MKQIGPMIAASGSLGLMYAEKLLAGVTPETFARLARPGGHVVQSNHPAFVFGHLSLYPPRIVQLLGAKAPHVTVTAADEALFKSGAECRDDADGTIYPPMKTMTERFFTGYRAAIEAAAGAEDDVLAQVNPTEGRSRELFPTIGAAFCFSLSGHLQNHLGQMSAWRRAMGLPPA